MLTAAHYDPLVLKYEREKYPIVPAIRAAVLKIALGFCGLELQEDGQVTTIPRAEGAPPLNARNKLSAMRIVKSLDRSMLEDQRIEQAMEARRIKDEIPDWDGLPPITSEIAAKALDMIYEETERKKKEDEASPPPPSDGRWPPEPVLDWRKPPELEPEPEPDDPRWPITQLIRKAIVNVALDLCGIKITPEGTAEPSRSTPPKRRIVMSALRILAGFDLLSVAYKRLKYLGKADNRERPRHTATVLDPEFEDKLGQFLHDERVKLRDKILAEEAAAAQAQSMAMAMVDSA